MHQFCYYQHHYCLLSTNAIFLTSSAGIRATVINVSCSRTVFSISPAKINGSKPNLTERNYVRKETHKIVGADYVCGAPTRRIRAFVCVCSILQNGKHHRFRRWMTWTLLGGSEPGGYVRGVYVRICVLYIIYCLFAYFMCKTVRPSLGTWLDLTWLDVYVARASAGKCCCYCCWSSWWRRWLRRASSDTLLVQHVARSPGASSDRSTSSPCSRRWTTAARRRHRTTLGTGHRALQVFVFRFT